MRGWRCIKVGYKHDEAASQTILEEILHFPLYVLLTSFFSEETITGPPRRQQRIKPKVLSLSVSYPMDRLWQFLVWSWQRTCKNSVHRMSSHRRHIDEWRRPAKDRSWVGLSWPIFTGCLQCFGCLDWCSGRKINKWWSLVLRKCLIYVHGAQE